MKGVSEGIVGAELFHKTKHEVCFAIGGRVFVFSDLVSEREYDLGCRMWTAIDASLKAVEKWEKYPAEGGSQ